MSAAVISLIGLIALAQTQTQDAPITIRPALARMVMVDAYVIDRKGRPVTDLKMEDFALLEDEKKVAINAFVAPTARGAAAFREGTGDRATLPIPDRETLTLVLYVDRRLLSPSGRRRALDQAFGIVESHLAQGARAVVVADDNGLRPLTPITTDPMVVRAALNRIQAWAMSRDGGRRVIVIDVPVGEGAYEFAIGVEATASGSASYLRRGLNAAQGR